MFHGREDAPYDRYAEDGYERREGDAPNREQQHHRHGHHQQQEEERPAYSTGPEHRGPPAAQKYGDAFCDGGLYPDGRPYPSQGGYEDDRRPGPYEGERRGAQHPPGPYEGGERRGSQYPPGPHDVQMSPYPPGPYDSANAPGHYGGAAYQHSPYAPAPHAPAPGYRPGAEEMGGPQRRQIPGQVVRLFCKADPDFHLTVVPRQGPVMARADPRDPHQMWIKDERMSTRVTDSTGAHAFALINKATGQALKHAPGDLEQCLLTEYDPENRDESVLWTQSEDMGEGYRCVRMANKITSNLDVLRGDKKSGGVKEGSPVILFAWKKQENQIWKIIPACKMPTLHSTLCLHLLLSSYKSEVKLFNYLFWFARSCIPACKRPTLCLTLSLHLLHFSYKSDMIYMITSSDMQDCATCKEEVLKKHRWFPPCENLHRTTIHT